VRVETMILNIYISWFGTWHGYIFILIIK